MLHTYRPLTHQNNVRLIKLSAVKDRRFVAFDFIEASLDTRPNFLALSYRWGSTTPTRKILLNQRIFYVRENLWRFLLQLVRDTDSSPYWIDAICINQLDVEEKSYRVARMDEIYAQASKVVVWLSYNPRDEVQLRRLLKRRRSPGSSDSFDDELHIARQNIQALEYWSRAWIVQEIALARSISLKCLAVSMPFENFEATCEHVHDQHDPQITHCLALVRRVRHLHSTQTEFDLLQWLRELRSVRCTDDRDRIYSLIGIYRQKFKLKSDEKLLKVDYTKSLQVVKLDCFFMLLSHAAPKDETECQERMAALMEWLNTRYQQSTPDPHSLDHPFVKLSHYMRDSDSVESFWHLAKTSAVTVLAKMILCSTITCHHKITTPRVSYRTGSDHGSSLIDDVQMATRLGLNLIDPTSDEGKMIRRVLEYLSWRCNNCGFSFPAFIGETQWSEFGYQYCQTCRAINVIIGRKMDRYKSAFSVKASSPQGKDITSLCLGVDIVESAEGSLHYLAELHSKVRTVYDNGLVGWFQFAPSYKLIEDMQWTNDVWTVGRKGVCGSTHRHSLAKRTMDAVKCFLDITRSALYLRSHRSVTPFEENHERHRT